MVVVASWPVRVWPFTAVWPTMFHLVQVDYNELLAKPPSRIQAKSTKQIKDEKKEAKKAAKKAAKEEQLTADIALNVAATAQITAITACIAGLKRLERRRSKTSDQAVIARRGN